MNGLIPQLIAMALSGALFMSISIKLGWSKRLWAAINQRLNPAYNATVWILFAAMLHITIQWVCSAIGISNTRVITGVLIGFYFAFLPDLGVKKK